MSCNPTPVQEATALPSGLASRHSLRVVSCTTGPRCVSAAPDLGRLRGARQPVGEEGRPGDGHEAGAGGQVIRAGDNHAVEDKVLRQAGVEGAQAGSVQTYPRVVRQQRRRTRWVVRTESLRYTIWVTAGRGLKVTLRPITGIIFAAFSNNIATSVGG